MSNIHIAKYYVTVCMRLPWNMLNIHTYIVYPLLKLRIGYEFWSFMKTNINFLYSNHFTANRIRNLVVLLTCKKCLFVELFTLKKEFRGFSIFNLLTANFDFISSSITIKHLLCRPPWMEILWRIQGECLSPAFGFAPTRRGGMQKIVFLHLFIPTILPIRSNKGGMRKGVGCEKGLGAKQFRTWVRKKHFRARSAPTFSKSWIRPF